jgi:leader peptidase (prepilin peptidase)/N-methyltransferase
LVSIGLWFVKVIPTSFPEGEPLLDVDRELVAKEIEEARKRGEDPPPLPPPYTPGQIRLEMLKEIAFLSPPVVLGLVAVMLTTFVPALREAWAGACSYHWVTGLLGATLGAMVGALWVWFWRIAGTVSLGRVAMGLGDVHLMFGVGAVIGAGAATVAFYVSPFFGVLIAIYFMITRTRRELPFGPYLSLGTAFVMLYYCPIAAYLTPGLQGLMTLLAGGGAGR